MTKDIESTTKFEAQIPDCFHIPDCFQVGPDALHIPDCFQVGRDAFHIPDCFQNATTSHTSLLSKVLDLLRHFMAAIEDLSTKIIAFHSGYYVLHSIQTLAFHFVIKGDSTGRCQRQYR